MRGGGEGSRHRRLIAGILSSLLFPLLSVLEIGLVPCTIDEILKRQGPACQTPASSNLFACLLVCLFLRQGSIINPRLAFNSQ